MPGCHCSPLERAKWPQGLTWKLNNPAFLPINTNTTGNHFMQPLPPASKIVTAANPISRFFFHWTLDWSFWRPQPSWAIKQHNQRKTPHNGYSSLYAPNLIENERRGDKNKLNQYTETWPNWIVYMVFSNRYWVHCTLKHPNGFTRFTSLRAQLKPNRELQSQPG